MTHWKIKHEASKISVSGAEPVGTGNATGGADAADVHCRQTFQVSRPVTGPSRLDRFVLALAALLAAATVLAILSGCTSTSERSQTNTTRTQITERHPTPDGGYVEKVNEYTEGERAAQTTTKADVDWGSAVLKAGVATATGDWAALGGVAATLLAAGGAAFMQSRRAKEHKDDATEGWAKYEASMKEKTHA